MGKNFIEINGRKYDAVTGKELHVAQNTLPTKKPSVKPQQNVGIVDGFVRPKKTSHRAPANPNHAAKNVQRSQTLARKAVAKPAPIVKTQQKPSILKSQLGISKRREMQAKTVQKSLQINKFENPADRTSVVKRHTDVPVKPVPNTTSAAQATQLQARAPGSRSVAAEKMIEAALANAQSHLEDTSPRHTKKRRKSKLAKKLGISPKMASASAMALAVVLLAGFFAVHNVPNFAMRVAATRAGFDASMPGYQPSGFSFKGPISYTAGQVTVSFRSNTDDRAYDVTQRSSNWNSDALLSNFIEEENKTYQTYVDKGRTLYIYDGSNATWVDNGVWYQVEGDSDMSTDQLIRIASSM